MEGVSEREPAFSKSHALARVSAVGYFPRISGRAMAGRERDATRLARFSAHLGRERENERNQTGPTMARLISHLAVRFVWLMVGLGPAQWRI